MAPLELTSVGEAELASASTALSEAFFDDPLFCFLSPAPATRRRLTALVFDFQLRLSCPEGHVYAARAPSGELAGVICLSPPGRRPPMPRTLRHLPRALTRIGPLLPSAPTLIRGLGYLEATARLTPPSPHWYVAILGARPSWRGRGVARALLDRAIALAGEDGAQLYLETTTEANVSLYEHFGFQVTARERPQRGGPPLWCLGSAPTITRSAPTPAPEP